MKEIILMLIIALMYCAWLFMVGWLTYNFGAWGFFGGLLLLPTLSAKATRE